MTKYFLILLAVILIGSCGKSNSTETKTKVDSTEIEMDPLVSDVNWGDEEIEIEETPEPRKKHHRSDGGSSTADNDADVKKYQHYYRDGNTPNDFAKAIIYPAIRMVYSDNFSKPKASVLNSMQEGDRHIIDLKITWKDHWIPKYQIEGTLEVNSDGSDARFVITDKNVEAEVLELTEDNFQSEITIPSL